MLFTVKRYHTNNIPTKRFPEKVKAFLSKPCRFILLLAWYLELFSHSKLQRMRQIRNGLEKIKTVFRE